MIDDTNIPARVYSKKGYPGNDAEFRNIFAPFSVSHFSSASYPLPLFAVFFFPQKQHLWSASILSTIVRTREFKTQYMQIGSWYLRIATGSEFKCCVTFFQIVMKFPTNFPYLHGLFFLTTVERWFLQMWGTLLHARQNPIFLMLCCGYNSDSIFYGTHNLVGADFLQMSQEKK